MAFPPVPANLREVSAIGLALLRRIFGEGYNLCSNAERRQTPRTRAGAAFGDESSSIITPPPRAVATPRYGRPTVPAQTMQHRTIRTVAAVGIVALALAGCSSGASTESPPTETSDIAAAPATGTTINGSGYSFAAPEGWSVPDDLSLPGVDLLVADLTDADGFSDNVNVVLSPGGVITPDEIESLGVAELEGGGASDIQTHDRVMVAGSETAHISAGFPSGDVDTPIEQYYLSSDEQTYVVTFSFSPTVSEADRDALSESVLASWAWV